MKLFPCPDCDHPISRRAPACPHCGYQLAASSRPKKKPRTSLTTMGCAGVFFSMLACCGVGQIGDCMEKREEAQRDREQAEQAARIQAKHAAIVDDLREDPKPMIEKAEAAIEASNFASARRSLDLLDRADFDTSAHRKRIEDIERQRAEERAAAVRAARHAEIEASLVAVSDRKTRCETWQDSWETFKTLDRQDPPDLYKRVNKAIKSLSRCRASDMKKLERDEIKQRTSARAAYVKLLDSAFIEDGFDIRVRAHGKNKTKLKLTFVFFSNRVWVKKVTDTGLLTDAERLGFVRVHFDSGFGEGFTYDLEPVSDTARAQLKLPTPEPFEIPEPTQNPTE